MAVNALRPSSGRPTRLPEPPAPRRPDRAAPGARTARPAARRREKRSTVERLLPAADLAAMLVVGSASGLGGGRQLAAPVAVAVGYAALGLYRPRLTLSVLDDLPRLLAGVAAAVAASQALSGPGQSYLPLAAVLRALLAGLLAAVLVRAAWYPAIRRARRTRPGTATLILGGAQLGVELGRVLLRHPEYGLRPIGYLDGGAAGRRRDLPVPLFGDPRELARVIATFDIRTVLVAFGAVRPSALVEVLRTCGELDCEILVVPRLFELSQRSRDVDQVRGIPLVWMRPAGFHRRTWRLKRMIDVAMAALGLAAALPVLAVCALAVRLESGPGVVFRQERVGLHGRRFQMLKLRSVRPSGEREPRTPESQTPGSQTPGSRTPGSRTPGSRTPGSQTPGSQTPGSQTPGSQRLGRVGRLLRVTSLDELPQLVNVLRGEMSLVGPRPERPFFVEQFARRYPRYQDRHRVPAGLTGWAAVNGLRGDTSIGDRVRFDNHYIENWSLWLDVKIMLRTLGAILTRAGG